MRAGWVNLPLPTQAFTGARLCSCALSRFTTTRQGIPGRKPLRLENQRLLQRCQKASLEITGSQNTAFFTLGNNIKQLPLEYGLEALGRSRWRRREVCCLSRPCCSEWRARWAEKVGNFNSFFPRLYCLPFPRNTHPVWMEYKSRILGLYFSKHWSFSLAPQRFIFLARTTFLPESAALVLTAEARGIYGALIWRKITPVTQKPQLTVATKTPVFQLEASFCCTNKHHWNVVIVTVKQVRNMRTCFAAWGHISTDLSCAGVRLVCYPRKQKQTHNNRKRIVFQGSWVCQLFTSGSKEDIVW